MAKADPAVEFTQSAARIMLNLLKEERFLSPDSKDLSGGCNMPAKHASLRKAVIEVLFVGILIGTHSALPARGGERSSAEGHTEAGSAELFSNSAALTPGQ